MPANNRSSSLPPYYASADFVGRQPEMQELIASLEAALSGQGRLIMLIGEPGIGKTRTAQELAAYAQARGVHALWGRCPEERGAPPYWPWIQVVRSYIAGRDSESLRSAMGDGAAYIAEIVPELWGKLPDLQSPPAPDPDQARFNLFDSITTFFKNASRVQSLVLVLDDLHWADASSLRLLEFLAQELGEARLLVLGTYRDVELVPGHPLFRTLGELTRQRLFQRMLLHGLSREEAGQVIQVTGGIEPPQELVTMVHWQTEGNPLFVGEVVRLLAQQGMLTPQRIDELRIWTFRLPEGIREVITRRFERLSERANQVLTIASVIGREFDFNSLRRLCRDLTEEQLFDALDETLQAHVIEEVPGGKDRYQFSHILMQQTLYENLPASRRARMHARVGQALEEVYSLEAGAHAAELAHHYAASKMVTGSEKLAHYSLLAGEQALVAYAWEEALLHFQRALAATEGRPMDSQRAAILFGLGRAQAATAYFEEAWASLNRALDFYIEIQDAVNAVAAAEFPLPYVPGLAGVTRQLERALELVPPESAEAGRLLSRYGRLLNLEKRDYAGAQKALGKALAIAQREQDQVLEMRTLIDAADVEWHHLHWEGVLDKSLQAVELARRLDDSHAQVWPRFLAGFALTVMGQGRDARAHATAAMALAEKLRNRDLLIRASHIADIVFHTLGDWQAAREAVEQGLTVAPSYPNLIGLRAILECELGDLGRGRMYIERLLEAMRSARPAANAEYAYGAVVIPTAARITGVPEWLETAEAAADTIISFPSGTPLYAEGAWIGLAFIAEERGDARLAASQYKALAPQQGTAFLLMAVDRVLGILAQTMGYPDRAADHFEDSLAFCREAGYRPELAWTCHDYAKILCQGKDRENLQKASALVEEGLAIASELGMKPLAGRLEGLLP